MPVEGDAPAPGLVEPAQELSQGRFAAAAAPDQRYFLPRLYGEREIRDQRIAKRRVTENDVFHLYISGEFPVLIGLGALFKIRIRRITHDVVHALHLRDHLLEGLPGLDQRVGRRHEGTHKALESHDHTYCKVPVQHQVHARSQDSHIGQRSDQRRDRSEQSIDPVILVLLRVDAGLESGPPSEDALLRAARLDRLDHADIRRRRGGQFGVVAHLHSGQVHSLRRDNEGHPHIERDSQDSDSCQRRAVLEHGDQIEHHHQRVQRQRSERIYQTPGDRGVCGLPVRDIRRHSLAEELHREPEHLPQIFRTAHCFQFALNAQTVNRRDPQHHNIDDRESAHTNDKGIKPLRITAAQQTVQKDPAENSTDNSHQRRDRRRKHYEDHSRRCAFQPLFCIRKDGLAFARRFKIRPRLYSQHNARVLPVELLH